MKSQGTSKAVFKERFEVKIPQFCISGVAKTKGDKFVSWVDLYLDSSVMHRRGVVDFMPIWKVKKNGTLVLELKPFYNDADITIT